MSSKFEELIDQPISRFLHLTHNEIAEVSDKLIKPSQAYFYAYRGHFQNESHFKSFVEKETPYVGMYFLMIKKSQVNANLNKIIDNLNWDELSKPKPDIEIREYFGVCFYEINEKNSLMVLIDSTYDGFFSYQIRNFLKMDKSIYFPSTQLFLSDKLNSLLSRVHSLYSIIDSIWAR